MASSSGTSSGSEKKRKRMISNRESARRSRLRKQKHQDDLTVQVSQLKKDNGQILNIVNLRTQNYLSIESENSVLRTQMMELTSRLNYLNEILQYMNLMMISENLIGPWSSVAFNQPINASSDIVQYY